MHSDQFSLSMPPEATLNVPHLEAVVPKTSRDSVHLNRGED